MIDPEAILYYADNPVDFVEDIIRQSLTPTSGTYSTPLPSIL